jgi:hypothetical protein
LEQHSESLYTSQYREAFIIRANDSSQRIELAVDILRRPAPPTHPPELAFYSNKKTLDYYSDPQNMMSKDTTIEKFSLLEQHSESLYTSQYSESFWFEDDLEIEFYECNEALANDLTVGTTLTAKPLAQAKKDFAKRMERKVNQIETLAKKLSDLEFAFASSKAAVAALKAGTENNAIHILPPSPKIEPATPSTDKPPPPVIPPAADSSQPAWMAVLQEQEQAETAVPASLGIIFWIDIIIKRDKFPAPRGQHKPSLFPSRRPNSQPLASPSGMPSDAPSNLLVTSVLEALSEDEEQNLDNSEDPAEDPVNYLNAGNNQAYNKNYSTSDKRTACQNYSLANSAHHPPHTCFIRDIRCGLISLLNGIKKRP